MTPIYSRGNVSQKCKESEKMAGATTAACGLVQLVLATHYHADHFDPQAVGNHLINNPRVIFVSTNQAIEQLESEFEKFSDIRERVIGKTPVEGKKEKLSLNGIELTAINLHHGRNRSVENLGFIFSIGGKKILHVGDTEASEKDLELYNLPIEKIDIAFVNSWYLIYESWQKAVQNAVKPDIIVVMHLPPKSANDKYIESLGGWEEMVKKILYSFPNAHIFEEEMEKRVIK
jgi:L-ascorbate metabolism protein UlaG (beta-lactamase superfamily)